MDRERFGHDVDIFAPWIASSDRILRQHESVLGVCGAAVVRNFLAYWPLSVKGLTTRG
jgi:hypothetical protein